MIAILPDLDSTDRKLLAALKLDGRASVTTVSAQLNMSRATIQSRMDRLTKSGIIKRFTIEVDASVDSHLIRAIMLIELEGVLARSVIRSLKRMPQIASLHTTNGGWDLVAHVETLSLADFDEVLRLVREIKGVLNSETSILLNTASA